MKHKEIGKEKEVKSSVSDTDPIGSGNFTTKSLFGSGSGSSSGSFLKDLFLCNIVHTVCIFIYSIEVIHRLG